MTSSLHPFDWLALWCFTTSAAAAIEPAPSGAKPAREPIVVDYRYAPVWWQTSICLPDDPQKTLIGKDGSLLYDYPGRFNGFATRITGGLGDKTVWIRQELADPKVPIVRTFQGWGEVAVEQEAFALPPARETTLGKPPGGPWCDLALLRFENRGQAEQNLRPLITVQGAGLAAIDGQPQVRIGKATLLFCPESFQIENRTTNSMTLRFADRRLAPGQSLRMAFGVARGENLTEPLPNLSRAAAYREQAERYWRQLDLPYGHLEVPDAGIQALLDCSIRNIYQAREIKKGLPAFQVGPTCYRGLWVVDGSFLMEAVAYLGRTQEARNGIRYLLSFQRPDGSFMLIDGHWKETGIVLWAVTRHARLTGDRAWLREVWPKIEQGFAYIRKLRQKADPSAPNAGLVPAGFSDGGLGDVRPEYTNVYWTLAGLRAAIDAARWLGQDQEAADWQREYDDFLATFRRAAARDMRTDPFGNRYLPIRMVGNENIAPQRAQWAFLHALFPGKVFAPDDPLVRGNLAMLEAVEKEGLVFGTGWLAAGIWNYFGSFYAHAWLWTGRGEKSAQVLYDFANHASPLGCWREEQMPKGKGAEICGDMPHNWASAEFIRLVRHSLVLERGAELHLCEGLAPSWIRPNAVIRLTNIETDFGPLSLELRVSADRKQAELRLASPHRTPPKRIVLHLDHWSGAAGKLTLRPAAEIRRTIRLSQVP